MRVKKFNAKDMPEAMRMVKAELGPDAIILHSREKGKGLWGLFAGRGVEITAAIDDKIIKPTASGPPRSELPPINTLTKGRKVDVKLWDIDMDPPSENPLLSLSKKIISENSPVPTAAAAVSAKPEPEKIVRPAEDKNLNDRLFQLETQLRKLTGMIEHLVPALTAGEVPAVPTRTRAIYNHLLEQDVDEGLALSIATHLADTTDEAEEIWTVLKRYLMTLIPIAPEIALDLHAKKPKIIMLVGPTGVGKTTTLAKISAQYRYLTKERIRSKIVFITADLFRLAAVEQLQKYTEILGVELEVTYSADEVRHALAKHPDAHLILFDTAGTSQRNMPQLSMLSAIVDAAKPTEVHLVLSATTKYSDIVDIIEHFQEVHPSRLIFTKIDESTTFGTILNTVRKFNLPISFLTTGQNVPEDIELARSERIAKLLLTKPTVNRTIGDPSVGINLTPANPQTIPPTESSNVDTIPIDAGQSHEKKESS